MDAELSKSQLYKIKENDVKLRYKIDAFNKDGLFHEAEGVLALPSILHPRLVPTALGRFESMFNQQVVEPLFADLSELVDAVDPEHPSSVALQGADYNPF